MELFQLQFVDRVFKIEKTAKFYSVCHKADEKHFAPELKRSIADRSPSQAAVSLFYPI